MIAEESAIEEHILSPFQPDPNQRYPTILLVGKRFSGKSTMAVAIASMYNVEKWVAFAGTKETMDDWARVFQSSACVYGIDKKGKSALHRIIAYQERQATYYQRYLKKPFPKELEVGLIFDDISCHREFCRGGLLEDLFSNGRHYKAPIIISCQYLKQLPPTLRTNTDYLFMLHSTKNTCELLYKEYLQVPDDINMFLQLHKYVTTAKYDDGKDKFASLVFNNCIKASSAVSQCFQYFCTPPNFRSCDVELGSADWRAYNKSMFKDSEWEQIES